MVIGRAWEKFADESWSPQCPLRNWPSHQSSLPVISLPSLLSLTVCVVLYNDTKQCSTKLNSPQFLCCPSYSSLLHNVALCATTEDVKLQCMWSQRLLSFSCGSLASKLGQQISCLFHKLTQRLRSLPFPALHDQNELAFWNEGWERTRISIGTDNMGFTHLNPTHLPLVRTCYQTLPHCQEGWEMQSPLGWTCAQEERIRRIWSFGGTIASLPQHIFCVSFPCLSFPTSLFIPLISFSLSLNKPKCGKCV